MRRLIPGSPDMVSFRVAFYLHAFPNRAGKLRPPNRMKEPIMKQSTKDQAEGKLHEVKGKIKEKIGRATNNPDREVEGQDEKIAGKVQKKIGQVEKVFEK
jgi:uncharacterized protein YjbJ (UPF0337 family)